MWFERRYSLVAKMRKLLQPQYLSNFRCIGPECEDSCCKGWRVNIDKAIYQKYRKCPDKQLREKMKTNITRNRTNSATDDNYAKIVMTNEGTCPFLTEDELCMIQRTLGEDYLSMVCSVYPRFTNQVNGRVERSLTLSCPEAAKVILKNPAVMEFDEVEEDSAVRIFTDIILNTNDSSVAYKPQRYFWELRIFTISTLQNRQYFLWQRLIILGLFYNNLEQQRINVAKITEIPQLIENYVDLLKGSSIAEQLNAIPNENNIQMKLMKELTEERFFQGAVKNKTFVKCFGEFLNGIKSDGKTDLVELSIAYSQAYEEYYKPFMDKREYMLENYLVNYVFKKMFPFCGNDRVFNNYVLMVVHYAMIKMLLIGMAGFHKENFSEDHVIKLIYSFSETIEHNPSYLQHVIQLLENNKFNTVAYMAVLIKN